jgi:hypothetical protein
MDDREASIELRSLIVRGDHAGLVAALGQAPPPVSSLQLIGDGLFAAVRARRTVWHEKRASPRKVPLTCPFGSGRYWV